jgi:ribosomal protein S18 acetylase RimI-like enzyme
MTVSSLAFSDMTIADYPEVMALWQATENMGLTDADSSVGIAAHLTRNPGLSLVARDEGRLVGAVLCGHDGRRAYLHHLAVAAHYRQHGIGRRLVEECLARAAAQGILKAHAWVYCENRAGLEFWNQIGWTCRTELQIVSCSTAQG